MGQKMLPDKEKIEWLPIEPPQRMVDDQASLREFLDYQEKKFLEICKIPADRFGKEGILYQEAPWRSSIWILSHLLKKASRHQ